MMHRLLIATALLGFGSSARTEQMFVVKYLSVENVYLNGGSSDGLSVGNHLFVVGRNQCRTELEVIFVADHSASCKLMTDSCEIAVGDKATLVAENKPDTASIATASKPDTAKSIPPADTVKPKVKPVAKPTRKGPSNVTGSVSLLLYHWNDQAASNLDFTQSTARLSLRARRLFDKDITFNLRTRGRYDRRERALGAEIGRNSWENRIWEFSFSYEDPSASINAYAGRLLPRRVSSAGYLDGLLLEGRLSDHARLGLFGGTESQWALAENALSLNKAGGYVTFLAGQPTTSYLEQSVAVIGEYHGTNVNRELIALQGRISQSSRWGMFHSAELDINRGWRKEKAGNSINLSSLYLGTYYRVSPRVRLGLSYDNRTNYWTYETKSTADSLFDDHLRQGIRTQLDLSLSQHLQAGVSYGLRKRAGDSKATKSYSLNLSKSGLWRPTSMAFVQLASFNGPLERGDNYSARVNDFVTRSTSVSLAYGGYSYRAELDSSHRKNHWFEIGMQSDLGRKYFLSLSSQFNSGDDIHGVTLQSELGWRF
jgi:hypothetical protein